jgi:hypothetical protein
MLLLVEYCFHPVGQGLFGSGAIKNIGGQQEFNWVYDCGTSSSQSFVDRELLCLKRKASNGIAKPKLNLVTISHFDYDHISGLLKLLKHFSVDTLLLPYMPLWQRLVLAFVGGSRIKAELMPFFVDPVAYLSGLSEAEISKIVFVQSSSPIDPTVEDQPTDNLPPIDDAPWRLDYTSVEPTLEQRNEISISKIQVDYLKVNSHLLIKGVWEFMPYNDSELSHKVSDAFRNKVDECKARLLHTQDQDDQKKAIELLKELYDQAFGKKNRNLISLFLYSGPLQSMRPKYGNFIQMVGENNCIHGNSSDSAKHSWICTIGTGGILYTGDGYLNNQTRINKLIDHIGRKRISKLVCLQVMHHGAIGNWTLGLAKTLNPCVSIFSSDPLRKKPHPHLSVWKDFTNNGPTQVDTSRGAKLTLVSHSP